ncbi:hypothetical protein AGMMS50256_35900 [Betaproteobacteria bacterium]|nr:hypothetical protein AGMMS50256_35900 [Betaproteobacteria bacterium]
MTDIAKFRREFMRWIILLTLNNARPMGALDNQVLTVSRAEFPDATLLELRRELDYLKERMLIAIRLPPDGGAWRCELTRHGIDVAEYTIDCEPGIARPDKYW